MEDSPGFVVTNDPHHKVAQTLRTSTGRTYLDHAWRMVSKYCTEKISLREGEVWTFKVYDYIEVSSYGYEFHVVALNRPFEYTFHLFHNVANNKTELSVYKLVEMVSMEE